MARYAVEHIWEGKQEYFLIRDHQSWQMVLLPSKYLTHLIRANRSPNTVGRRAKSIRFYLEYLDEKEMELSQVAELEFQEQYEHYVGFLHWLKAEEQTMKKKQVLAVSSALMIGTTTALTGLPTPVMAQENTEVVQEAVVEENKTEQVPVEQKTENAEVQENITDKEQEETAENAETLKEESTKQETPATPEKEVVTEDKTVEASKNTEVKAGSIAIDETHFPDKVFREQIIAEFDKDGDSVLSVDEISKAQFLNLHGMKTISSLEGIQYLTNLQSLDVTVTSVSDLSPVKSSFLKRLDCSSSKVRNHHHLINMTDSVSGRLLWKNLHWIFWMSLIPMATEWMGLNPYKSLPALFYGIILFMCAVSYNIVQAEVIKINGKDSQIFRNIGNDLKGKLSIIAYAAAIIFAFYFPVISYLIYIAIALTWIVPDSRLEKA